MDGNLGRRAQTQSARRERVPAWEIAGSRAGRLGCPKQQGEWTELRIIARAAELGLCVSPGRRDSKRDGAVESHLLKGVKGWGRRGLPTLRGSHLLNSAEDFLGDLH